MTSAELKLHKENLEAKFESYSDKLKSHSHKIIPSKLTVGKLYEAFILSILIESLNKKENYFCVLSNGNTLKLKSSPGKINRKLPRIDIYKSKLDYDSFGEKGKIAEIWTDVEFLTLSYSHRPVPLPEFGDYHELDILMVKPGTNGRPTNEEIFLGVECKHTLYHKNLLREILGVRRELGYLRPHETTTIFSNWPRSKTHVQPPICLLVYTRDNKVFNYSRVGKLYSIDFFHEEIR
jgi:hypothetical protein